MTFNDLKNESKKVGAAVALESFAPQHIRKILKEILLLALPISIVFGMFFSDQTHLTTEKLYGVFFAVLFLWVILFMLDWFYYSMYFRDIKTVVPEFGFENLGLQTNFELLHVVFRTKYEDVTAGFINSAYGRRIFSKLNISKSAADRFLKQRRSYVNGGQLKLPTEPTFASYVGTVHDTDQEFSRFLSGLNVNRLRIVNAAEALSHEIAAQKLHIRFWSKDSLGRIRGIGKFWARTENHHLERYGRYLGNDISLSVENQNSHKEVTSLERVLVKKEEANALIVGGKNEAMSVVLGLGIQIADGTVLLQLEHKKLFLLNNVHMISSTDSKTDLERELKNTLEEAMKAKHIIFVIENFADFISAAENLRVNVIEIFKPYFHSSDIQIIALVDRNSFTEKLERNTELMSHFEKILI